LSDNYFPLYRTFQIGNLDNIPNRPWKHVEHIDDTSEDDDEIGDNFENIYKGEISKSGVPILPSKRARKIPEKIQVSQEDLSELKNEAREIETKDTDTGQKIEPKISENEPTSDESLDDIQIEDNKIKYQKLKFDLETRIVKYRNGQI
jgi:hypothetical protein